MMNQVQRNMACKEIENRIKALCATIEPVKMETWVSRDMTETGDYKHLPPLCTPSFRKEARLCLAANRRYLKASKKEQRRLEKVKADLMTARDKRFEKIYALRDRLRLQVQFAECYEELQELLDQIPRSV